MIIQPQSNLKLLANVPFTPEQTHQIMFTSEAAQLQYMNAHVIAAFTNQSYVKKDDYIRLEVNPDAVYNCSYVMWQNEGFGNKWFYGFVTDIQYVSPECCGIRIQADSYQSWLFRFTIGKSFVEREHVADDTIGAHTLPEDVDIGPYVANDTNEYFFKDWQVIIQYSPNVRYDEATGEPIFPKVNGSVIGKLYSGCDYIRTNLNADDINNAINTALEAGVQIANIYMTPSEFNNGSILFTPSFGRGTTINGYKPNNNKLLTYPFNLFRAFSTEGSQVDFRYENDFSNVFRMYNTCVNKTECMIIPTHYEGVPNNQAFALGVSSFPVCSWADNGFLTYMSNQGIGDLLKASLSALTSAMSLNAGGVIGSIGGTVSNAVSAYHQQTTVRGSASSAYLNAQNGSIGFYFTRMSILAEYAAAIDDYFTRFGYKVNRYKIPATNSRKSFNYVKTVEAFINGNVPNEALTDIANMFNRGITLWHTTDVGNYSLTNTIVEGGGEYE